MSEVWLRTNVFTAFVHQITENFIFVSHLENEKKFEAP